MSRLRARVAERLVQSQSTAAILTTFNEVNMAPVMELRNRYKDRFEKEHGVKLGFMSFFVKAAVAALRKFPVVNASIDGNDIVYHGYFDIGIAVGSERGLVVPILRNADQMSIADIEKAIADFGKRAKDGKITLEELSAPRSFVATSRSIADFGKRAKDGKITDRGAPPAAPSPSPTAASSARCSPRRSSTRRRARSWASTPPRSAPWSRTGRWSCGR